MKQVNEKRIVLCADDFGMNQAINDGIVALATMGRLSATSCLVQGPEFASGLPALQATGLQTGLHLNFTESMGQPGFYRPVSRLIVQSMLRRLDTQQLHTQICTQLDLYEQAFGKAPAFIDGHQHVHQFAQLRSVLLRELTQRYPHDKPGLRNTQPGRLSGVPVSQQFKAHVIGVLGARCFTAMARQRGFAMNRAFLGVYDFLGGRHAYAPLLHAWLKTAQDGDMIMCHPATQTVANDSLGAQRMAEFQVLASSDMGLWMQQHGVRLHPLV